MAITAAEVNKLRQQTGAGMMDCKKALRAEGLVTRDPRMVERKKFGQKKARARFQFSKR